MGALPRAPWKSIHETITRRAKSDAEETANLRVAQGLFDFVDEHGVFGRQQDIRPLALSIGTKVVYWHPVVLTLDRGPVIPFFDVRRVKTLSAEGRGFAL